MIDYRTQELKQDAVVMVALDRYEELIITEQRYRDITNAALKGAELSSWNNHLHIDEDAVENYMQVAERDRFNSVRLALLNKRRHEQEAAKDDTEVQP